MGQKINPRCFRTGPNLNEGWNSINFIHNDPSIIPQDEKIRSFLTSNKKNAQISHSIIERPLKNKLILNIYAAKPRILIGKNAESIDNIKKYICKLTKITDVYINVHEVKRSGLDASIVAQNIAEQIEKRVSFRRAMKKAAGNTMKSGAMGIKIMCSGRLSGAEIARSENFQSGRMPLHTIKSDIKYCTAEALTTYGIIGIKVWIYKGDK